MATAASTIPFDCPSCGASLEAQPGVQTMLCSYCNTSVAVPPSAEQAPAAHHHHQALSPEAKAERAIRRFYEFDDTDLAANRSGQLTERQLNIVKSRNRLYYMVGYGLGGFILLCALCGLGAALLYFVLDWLVMKSWTISSYFGFASGILVATVGGGLIMKYGLSKAKSKFVLKKTEGPVVLEHFRVSSSSHTSHLEYNMTVGGVTFVLEDELAGPIKKDQVYAIYYLDYQDGSEGIIQWMERLA